MSDICLKAAPSQKYALSVRLLHWTMAVLVVVQFLTVFYVVVLGENDPNTLFIVQTHHAGGILVFVLLWFRLAARRYRCAPELSSEYFTDGEKLRAKIGHAALYFLLFFMPVTGYTIMDASAYNVTFYGQSMPGFMGENKATMDLAVALHWLGAWAIGSAVLGHIGFVVYHSATKAGAGLLSRMW